MAEELNIPVDYEIKAGVIGHPITHSLSPVIHGYWLERYQIRGSYEAMDVAPEDLAEFIPNLHKNGYWGVNVTIPHKQAVMPYLKEIDPFAQFIGAVNTIIAKPNELIGTNTDFVGFARNLQENAPNAEFNRMDALVLGAGGAARAVIFALLSLKVSSITITNRTREKADEIRESAIKQLQLPEAVIQVVDWEDRDAAVSKATLLVNTTSLGMTGQPPLEMDMVGLSPEALVTDIVYSPLETEWLKTAKEKGCTVVDGLGMLLHQAAPAFEAWYGISPEVTQELRQHVLDVLAAREAA